MTVRLVTDSNAMLPAALLARYAITAVPMTVVVDGTAHHEDELDPVEFCGLLRAGASVFVSSGPDMHQEGTVTTADDAAQMMAEVVAGHARPCGSAW